MYVRTYTATMQQMLYDLIGHHYTKNNLWDFYDANTITAAINQLKRFLDNSSSVPKETM